MAQQSQRPQGRPGAMTMAMQAAKAASGPKVLRIGVVQGTRMTEERIIRNRDTVTIGTTEKNTFTVVGSGLPSRFELFPMQNGQYCLNFTDQMEGRLALPNGVKKLSDLRQDNTARKAASGAWQVPLTEQARGKVQVGEFQFLFQFVVPPPPQPKPQLPAAIRSGWIKNIDWAYNACFSFFLVLAISGVAYVEYVYDPIVDEDMLSDPRLVRLITPPPPPEEPPPTESATDPNAQAAAQQQQQQQQRPQQSAQERAAAAAARNERQANAAAAAAERAAQAALSALNNNAEFAALTSAAGQGGARDALANGGLMAGTERDLANVGGISANSQSGLRRGGLASAGGSLGGRGLGQSGTVAATGDNIGSGQTVRVEVIRGQTSLGHGDQVDGDGQIDSGRVASLIRGQLGGIRACYERALRNNPTLAGRLNVSFTIGTSGRITSSNASGLGAAPDVGSCVVSRLRGLVFPAPTGGSVEFSFPFDFSPGGT
ncbi:MAG: AgmX/PglI C-terminal domain-containing protein [Deltaproteobacteria bacterium]|nr:AgmX/PglI C-terminal domain-containing protein [Deltaproteobacteria bacterium]